MYKTKNLGLNITEIEKDKLDAFSFKIDLGDNFEAIDSKTLTHSNITNCILEIPQDIKVEITDGVITVKEGSKIWVPYGTTQAYRIGDLDSFGNKVVDISFQNDKFFYAFVLQEDKSNSQTNPDAINRICWFNLTNNAPNALQAHSSGTEGYKESFNQFYYFTNTNYAKMYLDGVQSDNLMSLPICIVKGDGVNMYASVEQVLNSVSYIGSTFFGLIGSRGLIPNKKHEDNSLKNLDITTNRIFVYTFDNAITQRNSLLLRDSGAIGYSTNGFEEVNELPRTNIVNYRRYFLKPENQVYVYFDGRYQEEFVADFGEIITEKGVITSLKVKEPFRAVDHNDYQTKITELETKIQALQAAVEALQG